MSAVEILRRAGQWLTAAVYPRRTLCLSCGRLSHGSDLCESCAELLESEMLTGTLCPQCGHRLSGGECRFCHGNTPGRMRAVWRHEGTARLLVHRLKYDGIAAAATPLAAEMAICARKMALPPDTVVTWVTMPPRRLRQRSIDHSRLLAEETARLLGYPCRQLLTRRDGAHTQQGLGREERLRNLQSAFGCPSSIDAPVLLVDDVMTTSATARACAACLASAGAKSVTILTATQAG